ncbi:genetic suppressor element 1 isoform X2 [Exaiptasia diaphana]|uniref:Genetic suppressor element 1 n=1 Tax=Exaiptasia diaphana TaxID=2652724 RepID=A0A913WSB0_EXADI|nr:genetic suppressor element 1 isoform X2 [Exaiptasia diaphana]KXJ18463.1 hypothetical protein AC249_AIPGENE28015 [Exaiptasia diaphana]
MSSVSDDKKDGFSLMVKFKAIEEDGREGCYICGASNPKWNVYSKPQDNSFKTPFFPFLEYHEASANARPMENEKGKVNVCAVCFSFLTQQWRAFEEKETPLVKRIYWLKRPGHDIFEAFDNDDDRGCDFQKKTRDEKHSKVKIDPLKNKDTEDVPTRLEDHRDKLANDLPSSNDDVESIVFSDNKRESTLEFCFVCSRQKPKEFMRSVHTRPQLKTETPFYPCLSKHSPALFSKKMDFFGKVLVCEACQKFLFRQWQVFQKNNTPLGERQYQLRSDPSLPREQQSQLSTMVCFICGVTQPATSGRFLYSSRQSSGDPYYPFLSKLTPPAGAMPLTKQGLTRACSGCRKSLHRQWKDFEARHIPEDKREYRIRNDGLPILGKIATSSSSSLMPSIQANLPQQSSQLNPPRVVCYICSTSCHESATRPIYTRENTNPLKESLYFPFVALLKAPAGCRKLDHIGQTIVCKECYKSLHKKWEKYEQERVPQHRRIYAVDGSNKIKLKTYSYTCYLCGIKCDSNSGMNHKLFSCPHSGEGIQDGGSFFPFLASREPKPNAAPISSGTVQTCEICFKNLMLQWNDYENSSVPEESNRWLRYYRIEHVICYSCGLCTPRHDCQTVSKSLLTQKYLSYPPQQSIVLDKGQNAVVCSRCYRKAVKNYTPSNSDMRIQSSTGCRPDYGLSNESKQAHTSNPGADFNKKVIVIDSDDSEDDSHSVANNKHRPLRPGHRHAHAPSMHYTASVSPGVNPQPPSKDHPISSSPGMQQPSTSRSFAAALRKLAKQAMPPGTSSPATSSPSGSQPASPTVSHTSSRSTGVSPSRNSPATTQTPPPPRGDVTSKERPASHNSERELSSIATPVIPPIPALESDNSSTSETNRVPSRGPHRIGSRDQSEMTGQSKGHEVLPGVFSTRPRYPPEQTMLSEHYNSDHGHPTVVPYYLHGVRPEVSLFIPRAGPMPGPPPLLGSKRDGADPHAVGPFFPGGYPPPMLDSPDLHFETWRQQRAVEHLRQQQERQDVPLPSRSDHTTPQTNPSDKEKVKEGNTNETHEHGPHGHRLFYYNENKPPSCPVHGHSPGETHHKHPPGRTDPPKPDRPEEFNRMFLPPHPDGAAMLHPYLVHSSRDGPFGPHHLGERQAELFRERERQEIMMHQRMVMDPREHMKAREEEWQRRQQRLRQEKEEHQREMVQYRHQILQQQRELEQPGRRGDQSAHDHRRADQRLVDHRERSDKSPHSNERLKPDHPHENEMYRHYPFHPAFHPIPHDIRGRHPFPEYHRKEGDIPRSAMEAIKDGRSHHLHPFSLHDPHYAPFADPYPFHRDSRAPGSSVSDRLLSDSRWSAQTRPTFINGDLRVVEMHQPNLATKFTEELKSQLKKEGIDTDQPIRIKYHDKDKLRFLEGLGLVTLEKKKELTHGEPIVKRKFEESPVSVSQEEKTSTDSVGQREDNEGTSSDGTTDVDSGTTSTDTEASHQQLTEKIKFMARLGLVPPQTRHEMEQSYEIKRSERKKRKKKGRGRPTKRSKKDQGNDTENGHTPIDAENIGGPMTRQKQQLLMEQGLKQNDKKEKREENGEVNKETVKIKKEAPDESTSPYPFTQENKYKNNSQGRQNTSPSEQLSNRPPPRLTLQSLTNMEDPFNSYNTPTFRPPYLRHTGLLSVSQDAVRPPLGQPLRPEPVHSTGLSLSEQETRDYFAHQGSPNIHRDFSRHFGLLQSQQGSSFDKMIPVHSRPRDVDIDKKDLVSRPPLSGRREHEYRWPGVESVMKSYFLHSGDRDHEVNFLRENADLLKSQHASLNEEANNLSTQMTNLVQAKKHLHDEKKACRENLDRLHYFMQSFKR